MTCYASNLISTERALREGFQEKVAVFFYFVQITSTPPSPQFGQLVPLFLNANVPNNLGRGLPLPPHPQIDPIYTVCEKWTKNLGRALPPPHLDKIQNNSYFFSGGAVPLSKRFYSRNFCSSTRLDRDRFFSIFSFFFLPAFARLSVCDMNDVTMYYISLRKLHSHSYKELSSSNFQSL